MEGLAVGEGSVAGVFGGQFEFEGVADADEEGQAEFVGPDGARGVAAAEFKEDFG